MSMRMLVQTLRRRASCVAPHAPRSFVRRMTTQPKGYEAFGSFHTPSTAALFAGDMPSDLPPSSSFLPLLSDADRLQLHSSASADAAELNRRLFTIAFEQWTYLNHGAFGGPTKFASKVAAAWRDVADMQPLAFNDRQLFPYVVQSIRALARVLRVADAQELVLLPNATSGLHAVLAYVLSHALSREETETESVVFCFSTRYGAVRKMLQSLEAERSHGGKTALSVHEEPLTLAESYDDAVVLGKLETWLDELQRRESVTCPLVVVDHVTSNTGVVLPVQAIVSLCHARNIPVLVDGAHGLLNLPLDLDNLNADYYVGNCHKWFSSPKGAAFLHANKRTGIAQTSSVEIQPRVVSHGFYDGFQSAFMWIGLQDYAPWLSLPKCIAFWELQGIEACRNYMHSLAQDATELLYEAWGMESELVDARSFPDHKRHAMRLVLLPSRRIFGVDCNREKTPNNSAHAKQIQDTLHYKHRIEVPVKCVDGRLYVRISAHVYNHISDYETLAHVVLREYDE